MNAPIQQVVIVGGGTAGWLCAGMLAAKLGKQGERQHGVEITLIESPDVSTIGVGEGSWPSLRDTLREIGLSESAFITHCQASFKQGSTFVGWRDGSEHDRYHHPFTNPAGYTEIDVHACWQALHSNKPYDRAFSVQPELCEQHKAPKQLATPDYAYVLNYGYHFDATRLAEMVSGHCVNQLGVRHVQAHIDQVVSHHNGDIKALTTQCGQTLEGDLFIDCSGQSALLAGKHYNVPWHSVKDILLNDSAMAVQVPYHEQDNTIASTTLATAHSQGWSWDIGLQHRRGVGMVYSSDFASAEDIEQSLKQYLIKRLPHDVVEQATCRQLKFSPGYRSEFWTHNCLSLGMASGFIEPLEASAVAMVELGVRMLCEQFPQNRDHMRILAARYNERFAYRWARVIDFVKLHYAINQRTNDAYWNAHRDPATWPDSLKSLLSLWQYQPPSRYDVVQNEEIFPSASYQFVLYGMGFKTQSPMLADASDMLKRAGAISQKLQATLLQFSQGLPDNRALLNAIRERHQHSSGATL